MTDLPLLYPPHLIAITAILLTLVLRPIGNGTMPTTGTPTNSIATAAQAVLTAASQSRSGAVSEKTGGDSKTKIQILSDLLAESNIDIEGMIDCTQELISFYEVYEQYNEKNTKEQINRYVKARGLDR